MMDSLGSERPSFAVFVQEEVTVHVETIREAEEVKPAADSLPPPKSKAKGKKRNSKSANGTEMSKSAGSNHIVDNQDDIAESLDSGAKGDPIWIRLIRLVVSGLIIREMIPYAEEFQETAER